MKWYKYRQNNSFGYDVGPKYVYIQAPTWHQANARVEAGTIEGDGWNVYFDGCENGVDCSCCGDRWSRKYEGCDDSEFDVYDGPDQTGEEWFPWLGPENPEWLT